MDFQTSLACQGRETKNCLGQVFNTKRDSLGILHGKLVAHIQSLLELKIGVRFGNVSLNMSKTYFSAKNLK